MKKLLAILLAAMMVCLSAAAFAETLIMGTNAEFPPFEYVEADGTVAGFDVEIGKLIAAKLGYDFQVSNLAFDSLIPSLNNDQIDIAIAGMSITPARLEQVDFSDPYFGAEQKVIVLKTEEGITSLDDLADKFVGVQLGTTGHLLATDSLGLPENQVNSFPAAVYAVQDLIAGRVDAVIIDTEPARVFAEEYDEVMILEDIEMEVESYGVAVKKGNEELLAVINEVLAEIQQDGTYEALLSQFFGSEDAGDDAATTEAAAASDDTATTEAAATTEEDA